MRYKRGITISSSILDPKNIITVPFSIKNHHYRNDTNVNTVIITRWTKDIHLNLKKIFTHKVSFIWPASCILEIANCSRLRGGCYIWPLPTWTLTVMHLFGFSRSHPSVISKSLLFYALRSTTFSETDVVSFLCSYLYIAFVVITQWNQTAPLQKKILWKLKGIFKPKTSVPLWTFVFCILLI
jgi:hypothetical protein